ncbi:MAG: DinB family protein [Bacteroidota bacterium]
MEIQTKPQIIEALEEAYAELLKWLRHHDDNKFEIPEAPGKWSAGQHADHLIKSTVPMRKGLAMPKIALRTTFGIMNREERTYSVLREKYKKALADGGQAFGRYLPKEIKNEQKEELCKQLSYELEQIKKVLEKWDEKKLSKYILPHPLLGKFSIREMMYFTIFHTHHHLDILKNRY